MGGGGGWQRDAMKRGNAERRRIQGIYGDNGKENGNYYLGFRV